MATRIAALAALSLVLCPAAAAQTVLNVDFDFGMDDGEITPDGRYGVVRMNGYEGQIRLYDMASGALLDKYDCSNNFAALSGDNQDGVAVTNERAFVLANCLIVLDLNAIGTPGLLLANHDVGHWGRDLALTPDGSLLAVRGGMTTLGTSGQLVGGLFVFDVASGALLVNSPGEPSTSAPLHALDTVAVSDEHAVFLSKGTGSSTSAPTTMVTVFELRPAGGGPPQKIFETVNSPTSAQRDFDGLASDIVMSPDGSHVAVRSEFEVGLISLAGSSASIAWRKPPSGNPGPLQAATMDTLVCTNDRVATLGRWSNGGIGFQLDVFDFAGNQQRERANGDPHDLVVTPTTNRLLVRTHQDVWLYDLGVNLTVPGSLQPLDSAAGSSSHTSWSAGLDSIEVTDRRAVALFRNQNATLVEVFDITQDKLDPLVTLQMPEPPVDLAITPDESRVVLSGTGFVQVIDLRTNATTLAADVSPGLPLIITVPWSDGIFVNDDHALAFGYDLAPHGGWVAIVDLFNQPDSYCAGGMNSVGAQADIFASGSASIAANDLTLWSAELPPNKAAAVVYGDGQQQLPFAQGNLCVGGQSFRFPLQKIGPDGVLGQTVDATGPAKLGGAISLGTTWNFQVLYRDAQDTNTTDGLAVTFVP